MTPLNKSLLRELWRLRGQVVAAGIVVACGIAAFVTMRVAYESLQASRTAYYRSQRFADAFAHLSRAPAPVGARILGIPGVAAVDLRIVEDVTLDIPGLREPATGRLVSVPAALQSPLNGVWVAAGRLPLPDTTGEVAVSEAFARANALRVGDRIGSILNGRWTELTIVGLALSPEYVYEVGPGALFPDNRRFGALWMSRGALEAAFDMKGAFNDAALQLAPGASLGDVVAALDDLLAPFGGTHAYGRDEQSSNRFLEDELAEIRVTATYIPAVFLGVSAFLLYTLMSRLVATQRQQIGLLKAFGYSNARVGAHFLCFAALVVALGALAGCVAGIFLGRGLLGVYQRYFHFPAPQAVVPASMLAGAVLLAATCAAVGSLAAAWRSARLPPAEAMRPEPPRDFRAGALGALASSRWLGTSARLVLRNIARWPWRALLSILGIAVAVATVLVGRFLFDAVDRLMDIHFGSAQREDMTVVFRRISGAAALQDLGHLPGVLRVEGFRSVPVAIGSGHRLKRTAILGISPGSDLKQLIDASRKPIAIPPQGLVLTRKLAKIIGAAPGDRVSVEQLDGRRVAFQPLVAGLSDEPLGMSAYMDASALSRLLGEDGAVSGALLEVDRAHEAALYDALKRLPAIGSVSTRSAMLQAARDVLDRSFIVMTFVMTLFAAVLACGVIYNSARIALSERGTELASLRILGFSGAEVTGLLLGEQAFLTALAVPAGLLLGALGCRLLVPAFDREMFRIPYALGPGALAFAALVTVGGAVASGCLVARRIGRLDLVAVLKARE